MGQLLIAAVRAGYSSWCETAINCSYESRVAGVRQLLIAASRIAGVRQLLIAAVRVG